MSKRVGLLLSLILAWASPLHTQASGAIHGTVLLPTGAPAADAIVALRGVPGHSVTADSKGTFLMGDVPAGRYVLVATRNDLNPATATIALKAGDTLTVTLRLGRAIEMSEIAVTARPTRPYAADTASTGARIAAPLRDIPQTVTVVTRQVIEDRGITSTRQLAENVSGVTPYAGYDGYGLNEQGYIIRGMPTSYTSTVLRDGFKDFAGVGPRDLANVERVEFLKGPSSVLYGATGALGGIPNTITKQPSRIRIGELTASEDRYGYTRGTVDLGGPLSRDSAVRYRLIAAGERSRNFRPFDAGSYGLSVSPSMEVGLGARTVLRLAGEYTRRRYRSDPFLPLDPVSFTLPVDRYLGEPGLGLATAQGFVAQAVLEHAFADGVHLRQGFSVLGGRQSHQSVGLGGLLAPDTLDRWASITRERSTDYASQTELLLEGRRLGLRHRAHQHLSSRLRRAADHRGQRQRESPREPVRRVYAGSRGPGPAREADARRPVRHQPHQTARRVARPRPARSGGRTDHPAHNAPRRAGLPALDVLLDLRRLVPLVLPESHRSRQSGALLSRVWRTVRGRCPRGGGRWAPYRHRGGVSDPEAECARGDPGRFARPERAERGTAESRRGGGPAGLAGAWMESRADLRLHRRAADPECRFDPAEWPPRRSPASRRVGVVDLAPRPGRAPRPGDRGWCLPVGKDRGHLPRDGHRSCLAARGSPAGVPMGPLGPQLNLDNLTNEKYYRADWQGIAPQPPRSLSGTVTARF